MPCADDQIVAVRRAFDVLEAFDVDDQSLTVGELVRRTKLPKTSVLRLTRTLEAAGYLVHLETGEWRLGPAAAWLGARYQVAFDLSGAVLPVLRSLAKATGRAATLFVREGNARVRLMRVDTESTAFEARVGEQLPLETGSPGKVILAFTGKEGAVFDKIRRLGFHATIGETRHDLASLSAPVFGSGWAVLGALTVSCYNEGLTLEQLSADAPAVVSAARKLSSQLMSVRTSRDWSPSQPNLWHP